MVLETDMHANNFAILVDDDGAATSSKKRGGLVQEVLAVVDHTEKSEGSITVVINRQTEP